MVAELSGREGALERDHQRDGDGVSSVVEEHSTPHINDLHRPPENGKDMDKEEPTVLSLQGDESAMQGGAENELELENVEAYDTESMEALDEGDLHASPDKAVIEKADRSLSELHRWFQKGRIKVDPEWQRNFIWDKPRSSKLIESFLLDIPVPVVYLAKTSANDYEVIDGLQRLTSVFEFFEGKYALQRLDILTDLNGKRFSQLPKETQSKLEDSVLRSFELAAGSGDMHFIVFERLNTGGIKLNDMEIRNCLYRGRLNDLLKRLANDSDFVTSLNQPGAKDRMQDRSLVLRFLAFYERTHHKCQHGLKKFLNEFLETYRDASDEKLREYEAIFKKCMRASLTVFGANSYRLKSDITKPGARSVGAWATRPNAAIFQVIAVSFAKYDLGAVTRGADRIYEEYLDLIATDADWVDRVRRATGETARLSYVFETWTKRLEKVMEEHAPNDGDRLFTRKLKEELFARDQTCQICSQRIALLDDAALDHHVRYWQGGLTVPENARLVHRHCNLQKG